MEEVVVWMQRTDAEEGATRESEAWDCYRRVKEMKPDNPGFFF